MFAVCIFLIILDFSQLFKLLLRKVSCFGQNQIRLPQPLTCWWALSSPQPLPATLTGKRQRLLLFSPSYAKLQQRNQWQQFILAPTFNPVFSYFTFLLPLLDIAVSKFPRDTQTQRNPLLILGE